VPLVNDGDPNWRKAWFYEYNYEKQFPYTPNVRGIRTDDWKFIRYPHGDGSKDRHKAELYNLKEDPLELRNLADQPKLAHKATQETLAQELLRSHGRRRIDSGNRQDASRSGHQSRVAGPEDSVAVLHHFMQWLAAGIDKVLRYAGEVEHSRILRINVGTVIQRGEDLLKRHRSQLRLLAVAIG
jgi:arylsulfatase A-like enzyme